MYKYTYTYKVMMSGRLAEHIQADLWYIFKLVHPHCESTFSSIQYKHVFCTAPKKNPWHESGHLLLLFLNKNKSISLPVVSVVKAFFFVKRRRRHVEKKTAQEKNGYIVFVTVFVTVTVTRCLSLWLWPSVCHCDCDCWCSCDVVIPWLTDRDCDCDCDCDCDKYNMLSEYIFLDRDCWYPYTQLINSLS